MILFSFLAWYSCPRYTPIKNFLDEKISIEALILPSRYLILGLLYALAYLDTGYRSYYWIFLCAIYAIKRKSLFLLRVVSFGIVCELWFNHVSLDGNWSILIQFYKRYDT